MKNAEFENIKLAQIYEDFNQFSEDENFWIKIIEEISPQHIIDFGAGTGLFTSILAEKGFKVAGIEPAGAMLKIAQKKNITGDITWIQGSLEKLQGLQTDLVLLTSHVAQFLIDEIEWKSFLENAFNVLNDGGYLFFDSKNPMLRPREKYTREKYNKTKQTKLGEVNMQIQTSQVDGNIATHEIYYTFTETGEKFVSQNTLIYRTKQELVQDLQETGFEIQKIYGGWNFEEYSEDCEEMVFLAKK